MAVGMIGVGGFAGGTHVPNVAANPRFRLAALCDLDAGRLRELAARFHPGYTTTDLRRVLDDPSIELIVCGTPPAFRLPIMRAAVARGKHLFVEKPLCYDRRELPAMVALMRRAPIRFMVGFNRPYSPLMQALKPIYRRQRRGGQTTILYRIVGEAQLWPARHHRAVVRHGESTIVHELTHIFDLLNWLTDSRPARVFTAGGGAMDNVVTLEYPGDVTAVIVSGDNGSAGFPKERIEINTGFGTLVGESFVELTAIGIPGAPARRVFPYRHGGTVYRDGLAGYAARLRAWRRSVTPAERSRGYYYNRMPLSDKGHAGELEAFRRAIRAGRPSPTDVVRGAVAQLTAEAAVAAWKTRRPQTLNFTRVDTRGRLDP